MNSRMFENNNREAILKACGLDLKPLVSTGRCTTCCKGVGLFKDELSMKEFHISGMCQVCQDFTFGFD